MARMDEYLGQYVWSRPSRAPLAVRVYRQHPDRLYYWSVPAARYFRLDKWTFENQMVEV